MQSLQCAPCTLECLEKCNQTCDCLRLHINRIRTFDRLPFLYWFPWTVSKLYKFQALVPNYSRVFNKKSRGCNSASQIDSRWSSTMIIACIDNIATASFFQSKRINYLRLPDGYFVRISHGDDHRKNPTDFP